MSGFRPTTIVQVKRGTAADDYGDPADTDTIIAADVPVSIIESSKRVFLPAESRTTIVQILTGRARTDADIQEGDRLDDGTSIYLVETVSAPASPVGLASKRLGLRRIDQ